MPQIMAKLKEYKRVIQVARKPGKDEFMSSGKICVIGIILIGVIGFAIATSFVLAGI